MKKIEPVEDLLERLSMLENNIYTTKKVLTFSEACVYMGVSESLLYKLTDGRILQICRLQGCQRLSDEEKTTYQ